MIMITLALIYLFARIGCNIPRLMCHISLLLHQMLNLSIVTKHFADTAKVIALTAALLLRRGRLPRIGSHETCALL